MLLAVINAYQHGRGIKEGPAHIGGLPRSRRWGIIAFPDSGRNIAVPVIDVVIGVADAPVPIWPSVGRSIKTAAKASVVIPWAQLVGAAGVGNTCAQPKTGHAQATQRSRRGTFGVSYCWDRRTNCSLPLARSRVLALAAASPGCLGT
jgi:hypothetical protein